MAAGTSVVPGSPWSSEALYLGLALLPPGMYLWDLTQPRVLRDAVDAYLDAFDKAQEIIDESTQIV